MVSTKQLRKKKPPFRGDVRVCAAVSDPALLCGWGGERAVWKSESSGRTWTIHTSRTHFTYLYLTFSFYKVKGLDSVSPLPPSRFLSTLKFHNSMKFKIWFVAVRDSRGLEGAGARPAWRRVSAESRRKQEPVRSLRGTRRAVTGVLTGRATPPLNCVLSLLSVAAALRCYLSSRHMQQPQPGAALSPETS